MNVDFAYYNYAHGGRRNANSSGDGGPFDFTGLVKVIGHKKRWPHVLILGECDRYAFNGGEGLWGAAAAMREGGSPAYIPLMGDLPREWGPFGPAIFIDPHTIGVHRFYDHRLPDFAARRRNVLEAYLPGRREELFRVVTGHGDLYSGTYRLGDAEMLRMLAQPQVPCIIGMDWNSTPSGPHWEPQDLNDRTKYPHLWMIASRILWQHGRAQQGPYRPDTRALDYLCGYWLERSWTRWRRTAKRWLDRALARPAPRPTNPLRGRRVGGIGFDWVGELVGDNTPTNVLRNGGQCTQIDGFVVNEPWRDRIVPGSFCVQAQLDPAHPDSDHLAVRVAIDV